MEATDAPLLVLCHDGGWDHLYQAASCAGSAAAAGRRCDLVFFFWALERLAADRLDEIELQPRDAEREALLAAQSQEVGTRSVSSMLNAARKTGLVRLFACSASANLVGADVDVVAERVDEIIGWPTVLRLSERAAHVLYL